MAHRRLKIMSAIKANEKKTVKVTESDVWSEYVDYKDFTSIFDYRNEYSNSIRFLDLLDTNILKDSLSSFKKPNENDTCDLQCYEIMPPSINLIHKPNLTPKITELEDVDPFANSDDDDKDKDFVPTHDEISSSSDSTCSTGRTNINFDTQFKETLGFENDNQNTQSLDTQHCEYVGCTLDVFSTCAKCLCFLCWGHFDDLTSYNNCQKHIRLYTDQNISKKSGKKHKKNDAKIEKNGESKQQDDIQHCEYLDCVNNVTTSCIKCSCLLCTDHFEIFNLNNNCDNHTLTYKNGPEIYITKKGEISKRRVYGETLEERKLKIQQLKLKKIALKDLCDNKCKKKCATKISQARRQEIHDEFINLNWESQGIYIKGCVEVKPVQRRTAGQTNPKRKSTYVYHFVSENSEEITVCKQFFLTTLGFKPNNDRRVLSALKKSVDDQKNKKGSYQRTKIIDKDVIKEHIKKYNPVISHYRREHAPKRLYLPSDITIKSMYEDFCSKYPNLKVSFEVYRKVVRKDLNISFANLGNEECEDCSYFEQHDKNHIKNLDDTCNICITFQQHKLKYTTSRQEYQRDVQKVSLSDNTIYFSVDLQKVIMLPRMDQYKAAIFCPRIIAFNESFVPLGSGSKHLPLAVIWPETVSGRRKEDIISAYRAFFLIYRDIQNIVLWADNCSSQNKSWSLLTYLVYLINSDEIAAQSITIKYFEPGHSFMSADSFHHQVELSLQRKKKVYDFDDFSDAVKKSNSGRNVVKEMQITDFYIFKDESSQTKLKKLEPRLYLKDIMSVEVRRGNFNLYIKNNHNEEHTQILDFLKSKNISKKCIPRPTPKTEIRGITDARKKAIIKSLVPLMPENRRGFWYNLPVTECDDLDDN